MNLEHYIKYLNEEIDNLEKYIEYLDAKRTRLILLKDYRRILKYMISKGISKLTKEELIELLDICKCNRDYLEGIKNDTEGNNKAR